MCELPCTRSDSCLLQDTMCAEVQGVLLACSSARHHSASTPQLSASMQTANMLVA